MRHVYVSKTLGSNVISKWLDKGNSMQILIVSSVVLMWSLLPVLVSDFR